MFDETPHREVLMAKARKSGQTSRPVARKAARLLADPKTPKPVRSVAASALQQTPKRKPNHDERSYDGQRS